MDRFRRVRVLGQGGAGTVWLVEDPLRPGTALALKEIAPGSDPDTLRREFATLSSLRHPGMVEVRDFDVDASGGARFTMEAVEGTDLVAAARREGGDAAVGFLAEALRALGFLHGFGLVHRDLKPENLLVRDAPRAGARLVLVDFGLASRRDPSEQARVGLSGTLPYLAPELFDGAPPSATSDLYALGAVAYEAIHGRPPVLPREDDLATFIEAVRSGRRARPAIPSGWPAGVEVWLEQMLAPDPQDRPPSAREALARLNALCGGSFPLETVDTRAALLESGIPPGRDGELRSILAGLDPVRFPGPRVVWVCGDAGTGKSRLLRAVETEAVVHGWRTIKPGEVDLSETAPTLARWREEVGTGTTLLLLDEVESREGPVAALLDRIAREPSAPPLRVAAAVRPQEVRHAGLAKLLADVGTVPSLARIDLGPLGDDALDALVERVGGVASPARRGWLASAGERNAFATVQLLIEGAWEKGGRRKIPGTLDAAIARRLTGLSESALRALEGVSVVGGEAPKAVIRGIAGGESNADVDELAGRGLVRATEDTLAPASRALAAHVLERIDPDRLRVLRREAAERMAAADPGGLRAAQIARLWQAAGDTENALRWAERAADAASTANRPEEAAAHFAFGAGLLNPRDERRFHWRRRQGEALLDAGRPAAAARALGGAARGTASESDRAWARVRQAYAMAIANRWRAASECARSALDAVGDRASSRMRAEALRVHAVRELFEGRPSDARRIMEQALALADKTADPKFRAELLQGLAAILGNAGASEAVAVSDEAAQACRAAGHTVALTKALITRGQVRFRLQDHAHAETDLREALELAEENGLRDLKLHVLNRLANMSMDRGDYSAALRFATNAVEEAEYLGSTALLPLSEMGLAEVLHLLGRTSEAASVCANAFDRWADSTDPYFTVYGRLIHAAALMESNPPDFETSRGILDRAMAEARRFGSPRPVAAAALYEIERRLLSGEPRSPEHEAELHRIATEEGDRLDPEIRARRSLAEAARLLGEGRPSEALRSAENATTQATESGDSAYEARALAVASSALQAQGRLPEAREHRRRAREALDRAASRISSPDDRRSFLARLVFRAVLDSGADASGETARLGALYDMIRALNSQTDPEVLLAESLDMALRAVQAERGMILLTDPGGDFSVRLARNLEDETVADAEAYSRSIAAQAGEGTSILALDAGSDERFKDLKSISLYRIRSLMCVPLRSRGAIVGTVYLDSRREGRLFSQDDLRFVEAFADHAALALENARARARLEEENRRLRAVAGERTSFHNIFGASKPMQQVFDWLETVARSELPVLVLGESGTGKELVARAIHFHGPRKEKTFLSENCAAVPETLLETALFGHVRGAFTGADRDRPGLFEQADGGTLFLDEVGDMSPAMQARLLRVLQEGEVRRVGDDRVGHVEVRVVAATNKDLEKEIRDGRFREDLFYRLNVLSIRMPPLRERTGDIALLTGRLLERIARERGRATPRVDVEVLDVFERYSWPGNVRQLENVLQRVALLAGDHPVTVATIASDEGLRRTFLGEASSPGPLLSLAKSEEDQIRRALKESGGNRERAAKMLGISRATVYRKLKEYGIR